MKVSTANYKNAAMAFGAASFAALAIAGLGRLIGDPYYVLGSAVKSYVMLSSNLALLGILARQLAK